MALLNLSIYTTSLERFPDLPFIEILLLLFSTGSSPWTKDHYGSTSVLCTRSGSPHHAKHAANIYIAILFSTDTYPDVLLTRARAGIKTRSRAVRCIIDGESGEAGLEDKRTQAEDLGAAAAVLE